MGYEHLIVERDDGAGVVTLNRPRVLNALSIALWRELDQALTELEDDPEVGAIVVTGEGDRAFSAGADIHEMVRDAQGSAPSYDDERAGFVWHIATCIKPTVGAINGLAYGGGAVIGSSLDIRVGTENSSFRFLAATYGRVNSTWSLPLQIGWPAAKELLFTGRVVDAEEAHQIGLLNHLVRSDNLMNKALEIAKTIAANDQRMVQGIKQMLVQNIGSGWDGMYRREREALAGALQPTPIEEGFREFLDRKGRK